MSDPGSRNREGGRAFSWSRVAEAALSWTVQNLAEPRAVPLRPPEGARRSQISQFGLYGPPHPWLLERFWE